MSIQEGFDDLETYFAPMKKGFDRVFFGSPKEEFVEDDTVFEEFDTEEYEAEPIEEYDTEQIEEY